MARRGSSGRWLERQRRDPYVRQSRDEGFRSRAAYKLLELDRRDHLLTRDARVVDLGAAPGGWTQAALSRIGPRGTVVAVDVLKMDGIAGATVIEGDFREAGVVDRVTDALGGRPVDLVMSDMAPNISGVALRDEAAATELAEIALEFAATVLRPGGGLLLKLFRFAETERLVERIGAHFGQLHRRKPDASRAGSREFYLVARDFGPNRRHQRN